MCGVIEKVKNAVRSVRIFFDEVVEETRKTTWPQRRELMESTVVVLFSLVILALFVGLTDRILVVLLRLLTVRG